MERPQNWIKLCSYCRLLIVNAADVRDKITKLEAQLEEFKQQALKNMKRTIGSPRAVEMARGEDGLPKQCRALFMIHNFVANREYRIDPGVGTWGTGSESIFKLPMKKVKVKRFSQRSSVKRSLKPTPQSKPKKPRHTPVLTETDSDSDDEDNFIGPDEYDCPTSPVPGASYQEDPLAMDSDPEEIMEVGVITPAKTYCGLCDDNQVYTSQADLISHTDAYHRPLPPAPAGDPDISLPSSSGVMAIASDSEQSAELDEERSNTKAPKKSSSKPSVFHPSLYRHFTYDCPNCPQIKKYSVLQYAQHLGIHLRRPYQCVKCLEFFPDIDDQHWKDKHADTDYGNLPSDAAATRDKFVKIKLDPGPIWKCNKCLTSFYTEGDRNLHEQRCNRVLLGPKPSSHLRPCQSCQVSFRNYPDWRLHRAVHHPEVDRTSCYACNESFLETTVEGVEARHDTKLQEHMFSEHSGRGCRSQLFIFQECPPCGLVFDRWTEHMAHFPEKHGIPSKKANRCDICQLSYTNFYYLKKHMTLRHFQSEASICDLCGSKCLNKTLLAHHKLVDHGLEPDPGEGLKIIPCPEEGCGYRAVDSKTYNGHRRRHREKEIYDQCRICGKSVKRGHLKHHELIHQNKKTKPYQCEICGNSFALKNYLYIHKRLSHEGRTFPSTNRIRPKVKTPSKVRGRGGGETGTGGDDDGTSQPLV